MPERAKPMGDVSRTVSTDSGRAYDPHPIIGAAVAVMVAALYGQPTHVMVTTPLLLVMTGLGVTAGYHRLFAHHSFATFRSVERALMILGCMASCAPFFWVAIHRVHHRHSDRDGDPHSPHIWAGRRLGIFRGCWHSYFEWHHSCYQAPAVRDLTCRPDLVWIDRHWFLFYLVGLAIPGLVGFVIGGTTYDALIGFLWGRTFPAFCRPPDAACSQHGLPPVGHSSVRDPRPQPQQLSLGSPRHGGRLAQQPSRFPVLCPAWIPVVAVRPHLVRDLADGANRIGLGCQAAEILWRQRRSPRAYCSVIQSLIGPGAAPAGRDLTPELDSGSCMDGARGARGI